MKSTLTLVFVLITPFSLVVAIPATAPGQAVRAWEGEITIGTYGWEEDINPKFWALEGGASLSTTVRGAITYPYVMQDHLSRTKENRTYKALFLENEYLKVTCLPELGGRLHSVLDKTEGKQMFHTNGVIKPGMIAMRGAWISGGVEWNCGPHGHTVIVLSPVNALVGHHPDGSAYLEISNHEQIFRTRMTVRVTLHPGRAFLDERICLSNPTDGAHPYYFWNCTAFPNTPGTRFIYPMTLGTDHNAREFFRWPVDQGRDLTWLKNYETYASIFSVDCSFDYFGAYDVQADRGIVQVANHHELGGKKAWTWGEWEFGKVAQRNLSDEEGPYIEVQSGPLPTQSDYGMLPPRARVAWQEWWYPVHGLGDGFEYATQDLAAQTTRDEGRLELRLLATARFPQATCVLSQGRRELLRRELDLTPEDAAVVILTDPPSDPVDIVVTSREGRVLAKFATPLPIPKVEPPDAPKFTDIPDDELTVEQLYLKGRTFDRGTQRLKAREYYEKAIHRDPGHVAALRSLAVLDQEAGRYEAARDKLEKALLRDSDDGMSCFHLGVCHLQLGDPDEARRWGYRAMRCLGTQSLGFDLVGRAAMHLRDKAAAVTAFEQAVKANGNDLVAADHLMLALLAAGQTGEARELAKRRIATDPTALAPRALLGLKDEPSLAQFAEKARSFVGEDDFELLETSLRFAELGLVEQAARIVQAACVDAVPAEQRSFMPCYYLAWYASLRGQPAEVRRWLTQATETNRDGVFASRPEEVKMLKEALRNNPSDAQAELQLGCLLANLGRVDEAKVAWDRASKLDPQQSIAWRNLGLTAAADNQLPKARTFFRQAIAARPNDQTLYRDLAELLLASDRCADAIKLLETMPLEGTRRAEITVMLAQAYVDQQRYEDCIELLDSTPYFVNWEGQDVTWRLFHRSHIERGRQRLKDDDASGALVDFETALTYPSNLNVGRSNKPEEARAQYWQGKALAALGRTDEAQTVWRAGALGADVAGQQNQFREACRKALAGEDDGR